MAGHAAPGTHPSHITRHVDSNVAMSCQSISRLRGSACRRPTRPRALVTFLVFSPKNHLPWASVQRSLSVAGAAGGGGGGGGGSSCGGCGGCGGSGGSGGCGSCGGCGGRGFGLRMGLMDDDEWDSDSDWDSSEAEGAASLSPGPKTRPKAPPLSPAARRSLPSSPGRRGASPSPARSKVEEWDADEVSVVGTAMRRNPPASSPVRSPLFPPEERYHGNTRMYAGPTEASRLREANRKVVAPRSPVRPPGRPTPRERGGGVWHRGAAHGSDPMAGRTKALAIEAGNLRARVARDAKALAGSQRREEEANKRVDELEAGVSLFGAPRIRLSRF